MKKVIIIGCPGSGKSTFARELHRITDLPLHHLDMMYWNADKTKVDKAVFLESLENALNTDEWIIDGNYGSTMALRMKACDTVIFLDLPTAMCISGILERRGKPRSDIPWYEPADSIDEEFLTFVRSYNENSRPRVMELLSRYSDKEMIVLKSRAEADGFLSAQRANHIDNAR